MKDFLQRSNKNEAGQGRQEGQPREGRAVSWFSALKQSVRAAVYIDRSKITAFQAIRGAIGVILPLAIGALTGHIIVGAAVAGGALTVGSVGLNYTYKTRTRIMLLDCLWIALSAFAGGITGSNTLLSILLIGIWGFGAGMASAISQPAMVMGLQSCIAFIILSRFMLPPVQAAEQAALILGGALLQAFLGIIPSPWKNTAPERSDLSAAYQKLAEYAASPTHEQIGQQVRDALIQAHATLSQSDTRSQEGKILFELLDVAENIRLTLTVLAQLRQRLQGNVTVPDNAQYYLDQIMQSTHDELQAIADELKPMPTLTSPRRPTISKPHTVMKQALAALRQQEPTAGEETVIQQIVAYIEPLHQQRHTATKLTRSLSLKYSAVREPSLPLNTHSISQQAHQYLDSAWLILRANLTLRSTTFRHAIRLGLLLALTTAIYRLLNLPLERGYWVPLTVLLVLKPDFNTTFTRGVARMVGTILGAVLTTLLLAFFTPPPIVLIALIGLITFLAFATLFANYAIFSLFITMEVVFLLSLISQQTVEIAAYRAIDTTIGGIVALLAYLIWPTWEYPQLPKNVARRLDGLRDYFDAVMQAYADPRTYNEATRLDRHLASRLSRSNAEASVLRAVQEPHYSNLAVYQGLLDAANAIARDVFTLEAYLIDDPSRHRLLQVSAFARIVDEAFNKLASAVRTGQPASDFPDMQEALRELQAAKRDKNVPVESRADLSFVVAKAQEIVQNIRTMQQLLSAQTAQ